MNTSDRLKEEAEEKFTEQEARLTRAAAKIERHIALLKACLQEHLRETRGLIARGKEDLAHVKMEVRSVKQKERELGILAEGWRYHVDNFRE